MARKEALPYYKWFWRDWRSNRRVQRMSWQAKGLYRDLLDEFWAEGVLPNQMDALADICSCPLEEFEKFWPEIAPCFVTTDCGLINPKMDEQRTDEDGLRAARARSGRKGAIAKLANAKQPLANAKQPLASAKQPLASASKCHIAEQSISRAEQEQSNLPVIAVPVGSVKFDHSMVAQGVLMELRLSGANLLRNVSDVARAEIASGVDGLELMGRMAESGRQYLKAKADGKFEFPPGLEKFYGEGLWRDQNLWPWKEKSNVGNGRAASGNGAISSYLATVDPAGRGEASEALDRDIENLFGKPRKV